MPTIRTDLAQEAHGYWQETAAQRGALQGVTVWTETIEGFPVEGMDITHPAGEKALGKSMGRYWTLDATALWQHDAKIFEQLATAIGTLIAPFLPLEGVVLTAGLGNRDMTPDALGPLTLEHLLVTRHLQLPAFRPVAAAGCGVLGTTGMETAEWLGGLVKTVSPAAVILVDALAARGINHLCNTVQISNAGLTPGSGVGNMRKSLQQETLGIPVISVGVPTVVDSVTLARDLLAAADDDTEPPLLGQQGRHLFVTPDKIDGQVRDMAKLLGYGINLALQPSVTVADITALLT